MLQRKLRVLLTICYCHMLFFGLLPAVLHATRNGRRINKLSSGYLIYSACMTVLLLLQFPFMLPSGIFAGYMRNNIVLQWNLVVVVILRALAFSSYYGLVWLQRHRLLQLYNDFLRHWRAHWPILRQIAGQDALHRLQAELGNVLLRKVCVDYVMLLCSLLMQYQLLTKAKVLQIFIRITHMMVLSTVRLGFFTLLVLLSHQFEALQLALLRLRLNASSRSRSLEDLRRIASMHSTWIKLGRRAFRIYDLTVASLLLNIFVANVNILYHAVQFSNQSIQSDTSGYIVGDLLIVFNIWSLLLLMNMVDQTINSCNDIAKLLRQFSDLRRISPESQVELDLFGSHLRNNRLVYRICGCVVLDRAACLGYMATVLNHVIVLMQFDLKRKQGENMFTHLRGHK